ncbi:MAG TPA: amine dehydrogenase large subunit [Xanthobacteraceae bacterium]|nr:amine dehydrogenase large subunit [Xanthobacteraceae bacterium]
MATGLWRRLIGLVALCMLPAATALAQVPDSPTLQFPYTQPPAEGVGVRKMPPPGPHWAIINAPLYGNFIVSQVYVVDGDAGKIIGMLTAGMIASVAMSADHSRIFVGDTFFSRGTRGTRTDVVTVYDTASLNPVGEIEIPPKRQLAGPDNLQIAPTADGRLLLVANMTPATSVTVIDLGSSKVVGEIPITGCAELQLTGNRQFASLCGDGSLLMVNFDDSGKSLSEKRSKVFFEPEKDPVYAAPATIKKQNYYVTYHGIVHPVDMSTDPPIPGATWSLTTDRERAAGWRPGGSQPIWGHASDGLLYVLMHQGGEWTHKQAGPEIWVFNAKEGKRVERLSLPEPAVAVFVTPDDKPLIFAATPTDILQMGAPPWSLQILSADNGRYLGKIDQMGGFPSNMFGR